MSRPDLKYRVLLVGWDQSTIDLHYPVFTLRDWSAVRSMILDGERQRTYRGAVLMTRENKRWTVTYTVYADDDYKCFRKGGEPCED